MSVHSICAVSSKELITKLMKTNHGLYTDFLHMKNTGTKSIK